MHRILFVVLSLIITGVAASPLTLRTYTSASGLWIITSTNILAYSPSSQSLRPLNLDADRTTDTIFDATVFDNMLWISAQSGLYQIDMNGTSIVKVLAGPLTAPAPTGVTMDYVWLLHNDSLKRFDKLSREWFDFALPSVPPQPVRAILETEEKIYAPATSRTMAFTIQDEHWNDFPTTMENLPAGYAGTPLKGNNELLWILGRSFVRFESPTQSWQSISVPDTIRDIVYEDSVSYLLTERDLFQFVKASNAIIRLDLQGSQNCRSIAKQGDTLFIATDRWIIKNNVRTNSNDYLAYPSALQDIAIEKICLSSGSIVLVTPKGIGVFSTANNIWQIFPRQQGQAPSQILSWNDAGLRLAYAPKFETILRGSIEEPFTIALSGYDSTVNPQGSITGFDTVYNTNNTIQRINTHYLPDTTIDTIYTYTLPSVPTIDLRNGS